MIKCKYGTIHTLHETQGKEIAELKNKLQIHSIRIIELENELIEAKDKLHRRNCQIKDLKRDNRKLKDLCGVVIGDFYHFDKAQSERYTENLKGVNRG